MTSVQALADALYEAERSNVAIAPLRDHLRDGDAAYAVQEHNTKRALDAGRRLVASTLMLVAKSAAGSLLPL